MECFNNFLNSKIEKIGLKMVVYPYTLFFFYICGLISICQTGPEILEREIAFNGSVYSYYTRYGIGAYRYTAQKFICIDDSGVGNLATIDSAELDQLLYDLAAPNDTDCWIGLENTMRGNETNIWVDGSVSAYRNYPGQTPSSEDLNALYFSLRTSNGARTDGWQGQGEIILHSFICQRPVNVRECEFTNNAFCYRTFQTTYLTSTWHYAQADCVMWGGNLASITTESENTFLYLRTPNSALNCWIGLTNANANNEAYYWVDGEVFNYNMWVSGGPTNDQNADDCARSKVSGMNEWNNFNCASMTDTYICKRSSNAQFDPDLGELFGELINENLGFKELAINTILYRNMTLVCGDVITPNSGVINWIYFQSSDLSLNTTVDSNNFNFQTSIQYISVSTFQPGFYQCRILKTSGALTVHTVGVFELSVTTVAEEGRTYNYTIGIDRREILLLCSTMNNSIDLIRYRWRVNNSMLTENNPILVSSLPSLSLDYACEVFGTEILSISLIIREPIFTVVYSPSFMQNYSQIYPNTNQISFQGLKEGFTLTSNIEGRWKLPNGTYQPGSTLTYPYFFQNYNGLYTFHLYNWDGIEVPAMQLNITAHNLIGIFIKNETTSFHNSQANQSSIRITESITTVLCVGPNADSSVYWYSHSELTSNRTLLLSDNGITSYGIDMSGISTLFYLTCEVDGSTTYTIQVLPLNIIVIEVFDVDQSLSYTVGYSAVVYYSNASIPDNLIHWTTENVKEGENRTFNPEFFNPFPLSILFSEVGAGQHTLTCFYRNSPAMILGLTSLSVRDTANVTLTYGGLQRVFSDVNNPSFPVPVAVEIQLPTSNVIFACSLQECTWRIDYANSTIKMVNSSTYTIDVLSLEDAGNYSLFRTTDTGNTYITASISMNVLSAILTTSIPPTTSSVKPETNPTQSESTQTLLPTSNRTLTNNLNFVVVTIPVIILVIIITIVILALILVCCYMKRLKNGKNCSKKLPDNILKSPTKVPLEEELYRAPSPHAHAYCGPAGRDSQYSAIYEPDDSTNLNKNISETQFVSEKKRTNFRLKSEDSCYEIESIDERVDPTFANSTKTSDIKEHDGVVSYDQDSDENYATIDESTITSNEGKEAKILKSLSLDYEVTTISNYYDPGELGNSTRLEMSIGTAIGPFVTPRIPAKEFSQTYERYTESGMTEGSIFHDEFKQLNFKSTEMPEISVVEALKPENARKDSQKGPFDQNRVVLTSPNYDCNYINASWMDQHQFIATIHPSQDTLRDFLHMIYQTEASMVVMLTTKEEHAKVTRGMSQHGRYWPKMKDEKLRIENFFCKLSSSSQTSAFIKNEIVARDVLENKEHSFIHCISPIWNEDSTIVDFSSAVSLLSRIFKQKQAMPSKPIIIHCQDGVSKTGVIMTVLNVIDEMNTTKGINIFNTVKNLRGKRMHMVPNLTCYTTCYSLLNEYCSVHL